MEKLIASFAAVGATAVWLLLLRLVVPPNTLAYEEEHPIAMRLRLFVVFCLVSGMLWFLGWSIANG